MRLFIVIKLLVAGCLMVALPAHSQLTVVTFGDSITSGSPVRSGPGNGQRGGGYQPYLEARLRARVSNSQVINWGLSGEESWEGVNRINQALYAQRADWLLLLHGTNDLFTGISAQTTLANIGIMIDQGKIRGSEVIVSTLLPSNFPGQGGYRIPSQYNPGIVSLAANRNVQLIDLYSSMVGNWPSWSNDSLHPNSSGYSAMGYFWCEAMEPCRTPPPPPPPPPGAASKAWIDLLLLDD